MIRNDLKDIGVEESEWYGKARRSRAGWREMCKLGMESHRKAEVAQASTVTKDVVCEVCSRCFRRESDRKRHKCSAETWKPVSEQRV